MYGQWLLEWERFFRIKDWVHVIGIVILGYIFASGRNIAPMTVATTIFVSVLYLAHGYSLNDCFDVFYKKPLFHKAIFFSYIPLALNCLFAYLFCKQLLPYIILGAILAFIYSSHMIRLKEKLFLDILCNSLGFGLLFLIGFICVRGPNTEAFMMMIFIFILFIPIHLIHEIDHLDMDRSSGFKTTVYRLGVKASLYLTIFFLIIMLLYSAFICYIIGISEYFLILTVIFSIWITVFIIKRINNYKDKLSSANIRLHTRYAVEIYGIGLLILFYLR